MIIKCPCNICGGHIEFEADSFQRGTKITCPHCGMETLLFIPQGPPRPDYKSAPKSKLVACADCGREVSLRATSCPHCGAPIDRFSASPQTAYVQQKQKTGLLTNVIVGFVILLLIGFIFSLKGVADKTSSVGETGTPDFTGLNFQSSYFDVIQALGNPDKEIEERDVAMPNVVLGYMREQWIVYVVYDKEKGSVAWNFDKEKTHYLGIISTKGTVIHVADEKMRPLLDGLADGIRNVGIRN